MLYHVRILWCIIKGSWIIKPVFWRCSLEKVFLEISQNSQENTCARVSFSIKCSPKACNFIKKETLAQVFSCQFCEISKNTFSYRTLLVAAFDQTLVELVCIIFIVLNSNFGEEPVMLIMWSPFSTELRLHISKCIIKKQ